MQTSAPQYKQVDKKIYDLFTETFCSELIKEIYKDAGINELIVDSKDGRIKFTGFRSFTKGFLQVFPREKYDMRFFIGAKYEKKFGWNPESEIWVELFDDKFKTFYYPDFKVVIRDEVKFSPDEIVRAMNRVFNANTLLLRKHCGQLGPSDKFIAYMRERNITVIINVSI